MKEAVSKPDAARHLPFYLCALLAYVAVSVGCGGLPSVSGKVLLDGKPVHGANNLRCIVLFYPESGSGAPAVAVVDKSGKYSLGTGSRKGALAGRYKVAVTVKELSDPGPKGGLPGSRRLSPKKYADPNTSGWIIEVVPGANEFDFEIDTGA
ncbi:MAG: hypothetical protein MI725_16690 [Pirellulales bacterium]|nr:hypothetical protein [Pirellulales bacterium]